MYHTELERLVIQHKNMPFTVLKVSKTEDLIEVMGEFTSEEDAKKFAAAAKTNDHTDNYEYIIERPPKLSLS